MLLEVFIVVLTAGAFDLLSRMPRVETTEMKIINRQSNWIEIPKRPQASSNKYNLNATLKDNEKVYFAILTNPSNEKQQYYFPIRDADDAPRAKHKAALHGLDIKFYSLERNHLLPRSKL